MAVPQETATVLVVEDEIITRMAIAEYLRDCGYKVLEAATGDEAIRVLAGGLAVDVVFSDIQMPGAADGFALAQWIRRERPAIKVVLTSGVTRAVAAAAELCDDGPMLAKPYDPAQVVDNIRRMLAAVERREARKGRAG